MELEDFSDLEGRLWSSLLPEVAQPQITKAVDGALAGKEQHLQVDFPNSKGTPRTWSVTVSPLIDDGVVVALLATSRDVTLDLMRQRELERSIAGLRSANSIARVGSWELNCLTNVVHFSAEAAAVLGVSEGRQVTRAEGLIWVEGDRPAFRQALDEAIRTGSRLEFEGRVATAEGIRSIRVLGEPEVHAGFCVAMSGAVQDVTDWREALERLGASEQRAQAATEAMSNFLATMSHEIRTPLNGILGMAEAIERGELTPAQRERIGVVRQSGHVLLSLLNDLLDLSRIQEGQLIPERGLVDGRDLMSSASLTFEALVSDKDVSFSLQAGPNAEGCWKGDPTRVRQILNNLISNAVKFTNRGSVQLRLDHDGENLVFMVQDTGVGIPADRLPHIFQRFVQADPSTTRKYGGSGLGLAICCELAELMGGSIAVQSEVGVGTTFTVILPAEAGEAPAVDSEAQAEEIGLPVPEQALRILAAEDNPTNRMVLATLLGQLGLEATFVEDGELAVEAWRAQPWDLVLMDIQMPRMDGLTATRIIRREERSAGSTRTPIIALTANAMDHHAAEYAKVGMDGLIAKPLSVAGLIAGLNAVWAEPAENEEAA